MYCVKCASLVNNGSKYCGNCGAETSPTMEGVDGEISKGVVSSVEPNSRVKPPSWSIFQTVIRVLISIVICLILLQIAVESGGYFKLEGALGLAKESLMANEYMPIELLSVALYLIAFPVILCGLWVSSRWSRWAFTAWVATTSVLFLEPQVLHPIESLLEELFNITIGAILALIWSTEILESNHKKLDKSRT